MTPRETNPDEGQQGEGPAFDPKVFDHGGAQTTEQPVAQGEAERPKESGAAQRRQQVSAGEAEAMRGARNRSRDQALKHQQAGAAGKPPGPRNAWAQQAPRKPHMDQRLQQAEAVGVAPVWLGTRWRDIPAESQAEAWIGLRRWVDWLINEFRLQQSIVPACWYMHPNLVQELYAAMAMEQKAWEEAAASLTPMMMWHPNLNAMIMRLREMVSELGGCGKGKHQTVEHLARDYDEDQWRRVVYGRRETATVQRPRAGEDGYLVRARILGPGGHQLGVSDSVVGISPIRGAEPATVELRRDTTTATKESVIHLQAEAVAEAETVVWERAETFTVDKATGEIVEADWQPYGEEDQTAEPSQQDLSSADTQQATSTDEETRI